MHDPPEVTILSELLGSELARMVVALYTLAGAANGMREQIQAMQAQTAAAPEPEPAPEPPAEGEE